MYKITEFSHLLLEDYIKKTKKLNIVALDGTCGKGTDTLFLAKCVGPLGHVDSYDIQEVALNETKKLLELENITNVTLFHDSHEFINPSLYDCAIFNFGYLPGGDKSITTTASTSLITIKKLLKVMEEKEMLLVLCLYPGHDEGLKEAKLIDDLCFNLSSKKYLVSKYLNYNRPTAPYVLAVTNNKLK